MLRTTIPFFDRRGKQPSDLLRAFPDKAHAMIHASRYSWGILSHLAAYVLLPFADKRSHKWLKASHNPYLHEIETNAHIIKRPGVFALNLCYEWGCTSGAYLTNDTITMLRVLDWPFPALGKHMVVALQKTEAGEFYDITWPGVSGMFQGLAVGRFACAINQAPMRKHGLGFVGDWFKNRLIVGKERGLPPAHLLRQVFEKARDYQEAKHMLCVTPIAIPAIFTLTGLRPGEACVIERLEQAAEVKEMQAGHSVSAANEFHSSFAGLGKGWRPREMDSAGRYSHSCSINGYDLQREDFNWLRGPIINPFTRLVMQTNAATGSLMIQGFEGTSQVTDIFTLPNRSKEA